MRAPLQRKAQASSLSKPRQLKFTSADWWYSLPPLSKTSAGWVCYLCLFPSMLQVLMNPPCCLLLLLAATLWYLLVPGAVPGFEGSSFQLIFMTLL